MNRNSKTASMVRLAFEKGYRVIDGRVFSPAGKERRCSFRANYYTFTISTADHKSYPVRVHQLVAFQKFGAPALTQGVHIRHLDDNSRNNFESNIGLGTPTQNALDRPAKARSQHAAKGRQEYSEEDIEKLKTDHALGLGYKKLRKKYGIPLATLSYYLSKSAKRTSFTFGGFEDGRDDSPEELKPPAATNSARNADHRRERGKDVRVVLQFTQYPRRSGGRVNSWR